MVTVVTVLLSYASLRLPELPVSHFEQSHGEARACQCISTSYDRVSFAAGGNLTTATGDR